MEGQRLVVLSPVLHWLLLMPLFPSLADTGRWSNEIRGISLASEA